MPTVAHYYTYVRGTGRKILADVLGVEDPFALSPVEIVERVLTSGYTPAIASSPRRTPLGVPGQITIVSRDGLTFRVAVSRDTETVAVEEVRPDRYDMVE